MNAIMKTGIAMVALPFVAAYFYAMLFMCQTVAREFKNGDIKGALIAIMTIVSIAGITIMVIGGVIGGGLK